MDLNLKYMSPDILLKDKYGLYLWKFIDNAPQFKQKLVDIMELLYICMILAL